VMGTPAYMSPEQAGGVTGKIDGRSDIYSLGCMMFQMATGRLPFPGTSFGEVLIGHLQLPPPRPRELVPAIPEAYEALILKCLEKKQEDRYQSMHQTHDALAQVMEQLGISKDLPKASAEEIAATSSGTKTRSSPGIGARTPARAMKSSISKKSQPTPARPQATTLTPPPPVPPKPRIGVWIGAGTVAAAVVAGIFVLVKQQGDENRKAAEQAAHTAAQQFADQARQAVQQKEEEQRQKESEKIQLSVVSEPVGAIVEASWKDGVKAAVTPFDLQVPRNSSVRFNFSKKDFVPYAVEILADTPKVVRASLLAEPKPVQARTVRSKPEGSEKKGKSSNKEEAPIPVEF